ncbi:MAG: diguanylate cyclase [Desulfobulbaceae bacterium]|nr:diguanylate cyclase [Desulfobulbaceae bacterium]
MTITNQNDPPGKGWLLVVDDDHDTLELLAICVKSFGFDCVKANDGLEAMGIMEKQSFSIVITDMMMPGVGGLDLLKHIKGHYPRTSVVVVTGYTGTFSYVDVIKAGASDFIVKPFNFDELEAKLNRILRERELVRALEFLSNCDPLTGLFNRRYMDEKIKEEVHRADRQGYSIFLIIVDVDNFKSYNDEYGHPEGDQLLITVANILKNCTRADVDLIFRHGGDEFAITTPLISPEQVAQVGKRIIALFKEQSLGDTGLSLGVAEFVRGDGDLNGGVASLIRRADQALYQAKDQGRNQLVFNVSHSS